LSCYKKKLAFLVSDSYAEQPFDLIHVDIWEPCSNISLNGYRYFL